MQLCFSGDFSSGTRKDEVHFYFGNKGEGDFLYLETIGGIVLKESNLPSPPLS